MKQLISKETGPRSVNTGKRHLHILPGLPVYLDDDEAATVVASGLKVQEMDIKVQKRIKSTLTSKPEDTENGSSDTKVDNPVVVDDGIHDCPYCPEDKSRQFDTPQGLASHIRAKHSDDYEGWKESRDSD